MTTPIEMRRVAALGKMNAVVMMADVKRLHWMTSSCHYSEYEVGRYNVTIWTHTKEEAQLLLRAINRAFAENKQAEIEEFSEDLFTINLVFEY